MELTSLYREPERRTEISFGAKVDCATCHGDVAKGTVATRNVDHTMGFCVDCHRSKQASNDCLTCHY